MSEEQTDKKNITFLSIQRHYLRFERESTFDLPVHPGAIHHRMIVPIDKLNRAAVQSLAYARSISPHVTAVHVVVDVDKADTLRQDWQSWQRQLGEDEETHLSDLASWWSICHNTLRSR